MNLKKKVPLELWKAMQPWLDQNKDLVKMTPSPDVFMKIVDVDPHSDFSFTVVEQQDQKGYPGYRIHVKPNSQSNIDLREVWTRIEGVLQAAERWAELIRGYNSAQTVYDDPLEAQYAADYRRDFEIVDDDAETRTFDIHRQLLLTEYVERIEHHIQESTDLSEDDKAILLADAKAVKESISTEVKKGVVSRLSLFWAKCRRRSVKIGHFAVQEFAKELIKEGVKRGLNVNWHSLPEYIDPIIKGLTS